MTSPAPGQPTLRVNSGSSPYGSGGVSAYRLGPDIVASIASCAQPSDLLKSIFRVTIAQLPSPEDDNLPNVSGRYLLLEDEVRFIPHFPFETDLKYRATFDPRPLGVRSSADSSILEFLIPAERSASTPTEVTHIFPSCDLLPENILRFYVCFSKSMQRGRALEEISLRDSHGQPVADALYRPPIELWDKTMRHLTVLMDPGRLKRWVGPNVELGPPLKMGQEYVLEIGSRMIDLDGRPLSESFRKSFAVGDAVRKHISVEHWKILPPVTGSRQALVLTFASPLDWALLLQAITIKSTEGLEIAGRAAVDNSERRWRFTPVSPWIAGMYYIHVGCSLEDVCGNTVTGAFDRPLQNGPNIGTEINGAALTFQLI